MKKKTHKNRRLAYSLVKDKTQNPDIARRVRDWAWPRILAFPNQQLVRWI
jgi:hypothetical protein